MIIYLKHNVDSIQDQIKIFNGLYGQTIPEWKEKDKSYAD